MKSKRGLGNGFRKRSGLYKINNFWAFCGVPSISAVPEAGNPANPKGPWKWLPAKGADSTKSTTFGLLRCSLHVGGPRSRKSGKSEGVQNRQLLSFCGVPSISAVPEAGNPANPKGPWKWLPQKERALQNRQLLGFCGVPFISAVPEAGNPANPKGPWKWLPQKERTLQNRQLLGFCEVPSANPKRPWMWLPQKERTLQNRQLFGFCGVPSISAAQKKSGRAAGLTPRSSS